MTERANTAVAKRGGSETPASAKSGAGGKAKTAAGPEAPALGRTAKYAIGAVVRHRVYPFRGVIFDIDPVFNNTEEWWNAIPEEVRPSKDQPFYHLLAENAETEYVAYVSEQNLVPDQSKDPLRHPQLGEMFVKGRDGTLKARGLSMH